MTPWDFQNTPGQLARSSLYGFTSLTFPGYTWNWHHVEIARLLDAVIERKIPRLILSTPAQHGKALALDTPLATPGGWTTMGDVRPGDYVIGPDGPVRVEAVGPIQLGRPCYEVTNDGRETIVADAEHEWPVWFDDRKPRLLESHELGGRRRSIILTAATNLPAAQHTIDPWVLGLWLGDGRNNGQSLCTNDQFIYDELNRLEPGGSDYKTVNGLRHFRIGPKGTRSTTEHFKARLRRLGVLNNKHIPVRYLRGSYEQRLALLQGLIDSDGHVAPTGQVEYCSTSDRLARDVQHLVATLGVKSAMYEGRATLNGKDCGPKYRVCFYLEGCARLPRKVQHTRSTVATKRHYVQTKPCKSVPVRCIQVEGGLFLAGRTMMPTHNSELISRRLPAYFLGRMPDERVISVNYAAQPARKFGRDVRRIMRSEAYRRIFPEVRLPLKTDIAYTDSADQFELPGYRGGYVCAGVEGAITGIGGSLQIIDDPFKNMSDARSQVKRDKVWSFYTSTFRKRLSGDFRAIIVVATRWHEDDLSGRLLYQSKNVPGAEQWLDVNLEALKTASDVQAVLP